MQFLVFLYSFCLLVLGLDSIRIGLCKSIIYVLNGRQLSYELCVVSVKICVFG
jgi:hypothetical protein